MSQLLQVATRKVASAVQLSEDAPHHTANGLWYDANGILVVNIAAPISHHHQGLPFTADGSLAVELNTAPSRWAPGGVPFSITGRVVLDLLGANHYSASIPYNPVSAMHYSLSA